MSRHTFCTVGISRNEDGPFGGKRILEERANDVNWKASDVTQARTPLPLEDCYSSRPVIDLDLRSSPASWNEGLEWPADPATTGSAATKVGQLVNGAEFMAQTGHANRG